jgi:hypothetical protein
MESNIKAAIVSGVFILAVALVGLHFWENEPPTINDLSPTPTPPQIEGTPITWTVEASDPDNDPIYFQFQLSGPSTGKTYAVMQNWSQKKTWIWNSTPSDIGYNSIRVWVMDQKHTLAESGGDHSKIFENYTIKDKASIISDDLASQNVLFSNYQEMIRDLEHPFMVIVARNDSLDYAKTLIPNVINIDEGGNFSIGKNESKIPTVPIIVPKSSGVSVELKSRDDTFEIKAKNSKTTEIQLIPEHNPPGQNFATWEWSVTPKAEGSKTLILKAYSVDPDPDKPNKQIRYEEIEINVNVKVTAKVAEVVEELMVANRTGAAELAVEAETEATPEVEEASAAETGADAVEEVANETEAVETAAETEAAPAVEEAPAVETEAEVVEEAAEPAAEAAAAETEGNATATNETKEPAAPAPGFESVFAITGLLAVAYLVLGRKGRKNY